jgi:Fe-S oxidoreductase
MPKQKVIAQSLSSYDNPYQGPRRVRLDWTRPFKKGKQKPIKDILKEPAPVLYFVGCTGAYNVPERAIPQATASIFNKLGLDFGILGESELCCGSTAMRLGDVEAFQRIAESNLEMFKKLHDEKGMRTIVTSCAGCYRAILKDYSKADQYGKMMDGIRITHITQFLHDLFTSGQLKLSKSVDWKVTYHDPCHAGRHLTKFIIDKDGSQLWAGAYVGLNDEDCLYDKPRELLKAIPGIDLREMRRIKANSYCCGGGGGVMTGYNDWAQRNAALRIQEGMETGAQHMVSICPFCHYNLNQASQGIGSKMKLYDLTELIDRALPEKV